MFNWGGTRSDAFTFIIHVMVISIHNKKELLGRNAQNGTNLNLAYIKVSLKLTRPRLP